MFGIFKKRIQLYEKARSEVLGKFVLSIVNWEENCSLISGGWDHCIRIWRWKSKNNHSVLIKVNGWIQSLSVLQSESILVYSNEIECEGSDQYDLVLYDVKNNREIYRERFENYGMGRVNVSNITKDIYVAEFSNPGRVRKMNMASLGKWIEMPMERPRPSRAMPSHDGTQLAAGFINPNPSVLLLDPSTMECKHIFKTSGLGAIGLSWHPSGKYLLAPLRKGPIEVWDVEKLVLYKTLEDSKDAQCATYVCNGRFIAGYKGRKMMLWNSETGSIACSIPVPIRACWTICDLGKDNLFATAGTGMGEAQEYVVWKVKGV
jgi:WD40 repeat protein